MEKTHSAGRENCLDVTTRERRLDVKDIQSKVPLVFKHFGIW